MLERRGWPDDPGGPRRQRKLEKRVRRVVALLVQVDAIDPGAAATLRMRLVQRLLAEATTRLEYLPVSRRAETSVAYVAASPMPTSAANNVHVVRMASALQRQVDDVRLHFVHPNGMTKGDVQRRFEEFGAEPMPALHGVARTEPRIFGDLLTVRDAILNGATHVFTRSPWAAYVAAAADVPTVLDLHGPPMSADAPIMRDLVGRPALRAVFATTEPIRRRLLNEHSPTLSSDSVMVVPNAADLPPDPLPPFTMRSPSMTLNVGYAGSLNPGKGMELIVPIAESMPETAFHVVGGDGTAVEHWTSNGLPDNVVMYGHRPHGEVAAFLDSVDVLIAPYRPPVYAHGGKRDISEWMCPLKLFEYMAAGKPIVCSDLPVVREFAADPPCMMLCDPTDVSAWTCALTELENSPTKRRELGDNGRARFEANHTWSQRADAALRALVGE